MMVTVMLVLVLGQSLRTESQVLVLVLVLATQVLVLVLVLATQVLVFFLESEGQEQLN